MKQHRLKRVLPTALCVATLQLMTWMGFAGPSVDRPNILVILLDDFGMGQFAPIARQLGLAQIDPGLLAYTDALDQPYDPRAALEASRSAMPFMESLSEQAMLFSRAFAASSLCAPSRQGILTGTSPTRWGAYRNIDINVCGLPQGRSLVGRFRDQGYRTGFVGKWHVGSRDHALRDSILAQGGTDEDVMDSGYWGSVLERDHPLNHGFDRAFFYNLWECEFYGSKILWEDRKYAGQQMEYNTDLFTRKAMEFMGHSLDDGKPFFVELALHAVHLPLDVDAPASYARRFNSGNDSIDRFYSHIYGVDESIRRIVDMLKSRGAWGNTLLFFMSDNGATCKVGSGDLSLVPGNGAHRGHKGQSFLGGLRVPLVLVWPDQIREPILVDQAVSLMDVLPTALEAAGGSVPDAIDGRSLLPLIEDRELVLHDQLYFAGIHAPAWGYSASGAIGNAQERRDLFPGAWVLVEGDWLLRYVGTLDPGLMQACPGGQKAHFSLYNLQADPLEQYDLYATHPDVAERLKAAYDRIADTLPPPHGWDRQRWAELVPNPGKYTHTSSPVITDSEE